MDQSIRYGFRATAVQMACVPCTHLISSLTSSRAIRCMTRKFLVGLQMKANRHKIIYSQGTFILRLAMIEQIGRLPDYSRWSLPLLGRLKAQSISNKP